MGVYGKFAGAFAGAVMSLAAVQASAAVVTIDFAGNGGVQAGDSMSFSNSGVGVTVTAGATALNGEYNISSRIAQYSGGLGNLSDYSYTKTTRQCVSWLIICWEYKDVDVQHDVTDNDHEVDDHMASGHGVREFLKLDFGGLDVQLLNVDFGYHGLEDDASVTINSNSTTIYSGGADPISNIGAHAATNEFWILAGLDGWYNNDWKLKSVTFSFNDIPGGPGGAEVPVPAALSLLGLGLAGLAVARRRRRV